MTHYVLGFYFDKPLDRVVLIRKNKPAWQDAAKAYNQAAVKFFGAFAYVNKF